MGLSSELVKPSGAHPTAANAVGRYILGWRPKCRIPSCRDRLLDILTVCDSTLAVVAACRACEPGSRHRLMSLPGGCNAKNPAGCRVDGTAEPTRPCPLWSTAAERIGIVGALALFCRNQTPSCQYEVQKRRAKTEKLEDAVRRCLLLCSAACPHRPGGNGCRVPCAVCRGQQHLISYANSWTGSRISCPVQTFQVGS